MFPQAPGGRIPSPCLERMNDFIRSAVSFRAPEYSKRGQDGEIYPRPADPETPQNPLLTQYLGIVLAAAP